VANLDRKTVEGFGSEWERFDQSSLTDGELIDIADRYFSLVPWSSLTREMSAMDVGCGSGRWGRFVAAHVGRLVLVDASLRALQVAKTNVADLNNCELVNASVDELPGDDNSFDFVYSLGVLHHLPDTQAAIDACVRKVRPGGRFLVYLYYRFDNRPSWFRMVWRMSDLLRRGISRLPFRAKRLMTDAIALAVYWPMARVAAVLKSRGKAVGSIPLSYYRDSSFYTMRTDSLDRFGTRLEKRFSREEVMLMMERAGLIDVRFRESAPFWCAVGTKERSSSDEVTFS
jgi:SAM-dependent methyltransferase